MKDNSPKVRLVGDNVRVGVYPFPQALEKQKKLGLDWKFHQADHLYVK
jgi:hypothetical protein